MGLFDIAKDAFKSVSEANVLPIGILSNLANIGDDPVKSISNIAGMLSPVTGLVQTLPGAFSTKANVDGAGSTPVIAAALSTLADMRKQLGDGEPDQGGDFNTGANQFDLIADMFGSATPPDSWKGSASNAYGAANDRQKTRASSIADTDRTVKEALATEAGQVKDTRDIVDFSTLMLNQCIPRAIALSFLPVGGNAASYGFQVQSVAAFLPMAVLRFDRLTGQTAGNAGNVQAATAKYGSITGDAGGAPSSGQGDVLGVDTGALRKLSGDQHVIAGQIETAATTTTGTPRNVEKTHGTVSAATSAALSAAAEARHTTVTALARESTGLSTKLATAAEKYDNTDHHYGGAIGKQMPPR